MTKWSDITLSWGTHSARHVQTRSPEALSHTTTPESVRVTDPRPRASHSKPPVVGRSFTAIAGLDRSSRRDKAGLFEMVVRTACHLARQARVRLVWKRNISHGVLYRCASPVDPRHNRSRYADDAISRVGVTHVIDLADTEEQLTSFEGYSTSYFSQVSHLALAMGMNLTSAATKEKSVRGLRYIINNPDGVFAVHCLEGKDRTGLFIAMLECLEGATLDEVMDDYMLSYYNYYGVEPESELWQKIWSRMLERQLEIVLGYDDLRTVSLSETVTDYLLAAGLSEGKLDALHEILTRTPAEGPAPEPDPEPAPQPEPLPEPTPRPHVYPYDPWQVAPQPWPFPRPAYKPQPDRMSFHAIGATTCRVVSPTRSRTIACTICHSMRLTHYRMTAMSAVSRPQVRTSQPFATVSQSHITWRSTPAYSVLCRNASRSPRSTWQYAYPYDTTGSRHGHPSHYVGADARSHRRVRVNAWRVRPCAYGLYPHILDSHTDVYPWHWDWWA